MAHWAFGVNLILVFTCSDYRGPIYMGSNVTPWVLQGTGYCHNYVNIVGYKAELSIFKHPDVSLVG